MSTVEKLAPVIIIGAYAIGYLATVPIVMLLQWLINLAFKTNFDVNIWAAAGVLYVLWLLFPKK